MAGHNTRPIVASKPASADRTVGRRGYVAQTNSLIQVLELAQRYLEIGRIANDQPGPCASAGTFKDNRFSGHFCPSSCLDAGKSSINYFSIFQAQLHSAGF